MTQQEKAAFWTANLLMALPGLVLLVVLGYVAWTLKLFEKPWEDAGEPGFVWMMAGLLLLVAVMPGTVLFKLVGRKVRTGSFLPAGAELERFRARTKRPRSFSRRVLALAFCLAEGAFFALSARHHAHGQSLSWIGAGLFALAAVASAAEIFQPSRSNGRRASAARRDGFACPSCGQSPQIGKWWGCNQCKKPFDTFAASATCPHCGAWFSATKCIDCKESHPMSAWATAAAARAGISVKR
jgi:hypothetical protein